jgi:hypothetical protein
MNIQSKPQLTQKQELNLKESMRQKAHAEHLTTLNIQMREFIGEWTREPGDAELDRVHVTKCVLAALVKRQERTDGQSRKKDNLPGTLNFGNHATAACMNLPTGVIESLNFAAGLQNNPVTFVQLPPGLQAMPNWLRALPSLKSLAIDAFAGPVLDLTDVPHSASVQVVRKTEATPIDSIVNPRKIPVTVLTEMPEPKDSDSDSDD